MSRFNEKLPLIKIYSDSLRYYKTPQVDNKKLRAKKDIVNAKIITKNNFEYDKSTKQWKQIGKSSKLILLVKSKPISYKKIDTVGIHQYPITFEFKDITLGTATPFRWRDGSQKKPILLKKGDPRDKTMITNLNIKNQIQLQFFFETEFVSKMNGTLFGVCRANRLPLKTNPKKLLYFSKHTIFSVEKIILPFLRSGVGIGKFSRPVKN